MKTATRDGLPSAPGEVIERTETELAAAGTRYRTVLLAGLTLFMSPGLLAWTAWDLLWKFHHAGFEPFRRGHYLPLVSLYEAASYLVLFALVATVLWLSYETFLSMRRLAPDYRFFLTADEALRGAIAVEAASGSWPRTQALLMRAKEFSQYRPLIDEQRSVRPPEPEAEAPAPLGDRAWSLPTAVWITIVAVGLTVGAGVIASALRETARSELFELTAIGALLIGAYVVLLGVLAVVAARRRTAFLGAFGLRSVPWGRTVLAAFGVAVAARVFAGVWAAIVRVLGIDLPGTEIDPTTILPPGVLGAALTVLAAVILAPIVEEMVFRGVLLDAMRTRWGDDAAVYGSSLVFAAVHVSLFAIPPIFVLSVILGRMYVNNRSLWPSVLVHAFFNGIGVGALYLLRAAGAA